MTRSVTPTTAANSPHPSRVSPSASAASVGATTASAPPARLARTPGRGPLSPPTAGRPRTAGRARPAVRGRPLWSPHRPDGGSRPSDASPPRSRRNAGPGPPPFLTCPATGGCRWRRADRHPRQRRAVETQAALDLMPDSRLMGVCRDSSSRKELLSSLPKAVAQHCLLALGLSAAIRHDIVRFSDHRDERCTRVLGVCKVFCHCCAPTFMVCNEDCIWTVSPPVDKCNDRT